MNKFLTVVLVIFSFGRSTEAAMLYKDFIIVDNVIWALTTTGSIQLIDAKTRTIITDIVKNDSEILVLVKDKYNDVVIADKDRKVKRYNKSRHDWQLVGTYTSAIFGLVFDRANKCYMITDKGMSKAGVSDVYFTVKSINNSFTYKDNWRAITSYHMDMNDVIWLGYDYGEWGGDLMMFDTKTNQFISPAYTSVSINLHGVRAIFDDSSSVYVSSGVNHMFLSGGSIIKFNAVQPTALFSSQSHWDKPTRAEQGNPPKTVQLQRMMPGEYIGPATYDKQTKSIYFYSQNGFFKGNKTSDLSTIANWKLLIKPSLQWTEGQQYAAGAAMNVLKIIVVGDERFYFLSQNDGMGYVDGQKLAMLP